MSIEDIEKARAKKLSSILREKGHELPHLSALDVIAKMEGFRNWNTYQAQLASREKLHPIRKGWALGGDRREHYDAGCDPILTYRDEPVFVLRHKPNKLSAPEGFATIVQTIRADEYRNQTIRFSAALKVEKCDGATTIWLRADDKAKMPVAFDNLETSSDQPPLSGKSGWTKREILLHIPETADRISFGYYLRGQGISYAADFSLNVASGEKLDAPQSAPLLTQPINMS